MLSTIKSNERRTAPRENVLLRGKVLFGTTMHDVIVLDRSKGGVRARTPVPLQLPVTFAFHYDNETEFEARLRWSSGTEFGASLLSARAVSGLSSRMLVDVHDLMRGRLFADAYARLRACNLQADLELCSLLDRAEAANAELEEALRRSVARG